MTWRPMIAVGWLVVLGLAGAGLAVAGLVRARRSPLATRLAWVLRLVMVVALVVVLARPSVGTPVEVQQETTNVDVLVVVDRTGSMAAEDWNGSQTRLDGVRSDLAALADDLPDVRWSVLTWDSEAVRTLPFTTDAEALRSWSASLRQEITGYSSGSALDRPLAAVTDALTTDRTRHPDHRRMVVLMSDGEATVGRTVASFGQVKPLIDGGVVLGYGTAAGARMRSYDGSATLDPDAPWITDQSGRPAVSKIDEGALRTVASQLGVDYLHRTTADPADLDRWAAGLHARPVLEGTKKSTTWLATTWPAALVLVAALAGELWLTVVRPTRRRTR